MAKQYKSIIKIANPQDLLPRYNSTHDLTIDLDGCQMTSLEECYAEFAKKLNFPPYFGENMNALYDMLTDLSWLSFDNILLVIHQSYLLLDKGNPEDKDALLELLELASDYWSQPVEAGKSCRKNPITFKTLLMET